MRLTIGVVLAALLSPLAHAELIDDVNDRNELRIAINADSANNVKQDGQWTGVEIELGQALAKELDVKVEFFAVTHDELVEGVEKGTYDIALDQITRSEALKQRVDFSQPYTKGPEQSVYAVPFQKNNPAFESAVNNALQRIKDDGRLAALAQHGTQPATESSLAPDPEP